MECRLETVTPKKAAEWLKLNTKNRPLSQAHVDSLANAIKRGEFKVNGDTIKLNESVLIDGQHRLHAVLQSNIAIQSYIVRGVQKDAYDTLDQGKKRNIADFFARDGKKYYAELATAVRYVYLYRNDLLRSFGTSKKMTPTVAEAILKSSHGLCDSVEFVYSLGTKKFFSVGVLAALHWLCAQKSKDDADKFLAQIVAGEGIVKSMPSYAVRERIINGRKQKGRLDSTYIFGVCLKAWNMFRDNRRVNAGLMWRDDEAMAEVK